MSETTDKNHKSSNLLPDKKPIEAIDKDRRIYDLEQRLRRLEKRTKNNERFSKTFADCLSSQVIAIDAVTAIVRRSLREDSGIQDELSAAIKDYDRHKVTRWFSGLFGVVFRVAALCSAGFMGAFIYWVFSGK